jgi:hypothetical protein
MAKIQTIRMVIFASFVTLGLAFSTSTANADPESVKKITKAIKAALESPGDPFTQIMSAFTAVGDFTLNKKELKEIIAPFGQSDLVDDLLGGANAIMKSGDRVTLTRRSKFKTKIGEGVLALDKTVRFRIRRENGGVKVDKVEGLSVAEAGGGFYPLRWLTVAEENEKLTLTLNAGYALFNKTKKIDLPKPEPTPTTEEEPNGERGLGGDPVLPGDSSRTPVIPAPPGNSGNVAAKRTQKKVSTQGLMGALGKSTAPSKDPKKQKP